MIQGWKLWLDDQADLVLDDGTILRPTPEGFITAHSSDPAKMLVKVKGPPEFMDLDCDLGADDSAMKFLKWLAYEYDCKPPLYAIHSENCVERLNVASFMESWRKSLDL